MSALLNWYKLLPLGPESSEVPGSVGRVLIHGGSSTKSGSMMELQGVHYETDSGVVKFGLYRKHVFGDQYTRVDDIPADQVERPGFGRVAFTPPTRLRAPSRVLNAKWQFRDNLGSPPSGTILTTRFGHLEVSAVSAQIGAGFDGTPSATAQLHVLAKPVKDPEIDVFLLLPDGRAPEGARYIERGYRDLGDLVRSDAEDSLQQESDSERSSGLKGLVNAALYSVGTVRVSVTPSMIEVGAGEAGSCTIDVEMPSPGRVAFAVQGVFRTPQGESDDDDDIDKDLRDVVVSDIYTIELSENGELTIF